MLLNLLLSLKIHTAKIFCWAPAIRVHLFIFVKYSNSMVSEAIHANKWLKLNWHLPAFLMPKQVLEKIFKKSCCINTNRYRFPQVFFSWETVNSSRTESSQKWFPAPLLLNWMLEKSQQLDGLVRHGASTGRLLSSGNPGKVGEVEIQTIGEAGTCSRKAQNGAAKTEGWDWIQAHTEQEAEKKRRDGRSPCPARFHLIHHASADGRGLMNTIIYGPRLADTRLKEKGTNLTLRYTSVKLNPEQLLWLLVQYWCLWSVTPAVSGVVLCLSQLLLQGIEDPSKLTWRNLLHTISYNFNRYWTLHDFRWCAKWINPCLISADSKSNAMLGYALAFWSAFHSLCLNVLTFQ